MAEARVWLKFSSKKRDGTILNFRIQELTSDRFEDVIEFNTKYFITSESIQKAAGIYRNPESLEEYNQIIKGMLNKDDHMTVICCLDNSDGKGDVLGMSSMALEKENAEHLINKLQSKLKTKEVRKMFEMIIGLGEMYEGKNQYISKGYYEGRGVVVHPDYRGLGIAQQFLKVRRLMCMEHGIPMTMAWMTSIGTQKAAERDGWKTVFEIPFDDLERQFGVTFQDTPPMCKLMLVEVK